FQQGEIVQIIGPRALREGDLAVERRRIARVPGMAEDIAEEAVVAVEREAPLRVDRQPVDEDGAVLLMPGIGLLLNCQYRRKVRLEHLPPVPRTRHLALLRVRAHISSAYAPRRPSLPHPARFVLP